MLIALLFNLVDFRVLSHLIFAQARGPSISYCLFERAGILIKACSLIPHRGCRLTQKGRLWRSLRGIFLEMLVDIQSSLYNDVLAILSKMFDCLTSL